MQWQHILTTTWLVVEYLIKIIAIGTVPENRRPSSSQAWLLLILLLPGVGLPLYALIGSPYVRGRRSEIQKQATAMIAEAGAQLPQVPEGAAPSRELATVIRMNHQLTGLSCVTGANNGLLDDTPETFQAMALAIRQAERYVHFEFYIAAWDQTTEPIFAALEDAASRGVKVRFLMDQIGSRKYKGWKQFKKRLTAAGIDWHLMMPINLFRGQWRRPDLRNHRKLLVVDGEVGFMGSHNVIDPHYASAKNQKIGRTWRDLSIMVSGDIVLQLEAVFATDWYTETGEMLDPDLHFIDKDDLPPGGVNNCLQLVPSGPGFVTEPNLRLFTALVHGAVESVSICSPYFVPDESLLNAMTSAVYRGVRVDLFVGEQADQFFVGHAQRSYYEALLEAGVHIWLYPAPTILHSKFLTIDGHLGVMGSSNMDIRSFVLDYEIVLLAFGGDIVEQLQAKDAEYRAVSRELTLAEWRQRPWHQRYLNNVCRLVSAVM